MGSGTAGHVEYLSNLDVALLDGFGPVALQTIINLMAITEKHFANLDEAMSSNLEAMAEYYLSMTKSKGKTKSNVN